MSPDPAMSASRRGTESAKARAARATAAYGGQKREKREPDWEQVDQYLPLVKSITGRMKHYFPSHIDIRDIYSIGLSGLITASQNFDSSRDTSFGAYAGIRIRGALLDELRRMDWMPRLKRVNQKKFRKGLDALRQELGREPTDEEVCEQLGLTPAELANLRAQPSKLTLVPLNAPVGEEGNERGSLDEVLADINQPDAAETVEKKDLIQALRLGLDKLPDMSKKVLAMYYLKGLRLAEIALAVGLTESRISQIHAQAIKELRSLLKKDFSA